MRNTRVANYEDTPRDVIATGNEYVSGTLLPSHTHKRGQCLYAVAGVLTVITSEGSWVVPPRRALWIPPGMPHTVQMGGLTALRSAYLLPEVAARAGLSAHCTVLSVSPLLDALLAEAVDLPAEYPLGGRDERVMRLLVDEIAHMPSLPLSTPLPQDPRLARLCRALIHAPSLEIDIDTMAHQAGMSRRNFTRLFREQTGMSFSSWRQQACLLSALSRLARGQSVTQVAIELGYSSSSAFTAAFRRTLGAAPSHYLLPQAA
ncbi:AraC family transcriptional regulator [Dyella acidiphila]|uniref:Helix-turn-helix transcriptional regulator n=1 Tax=Dyella acidiphila TaxID=2775866 RepID=A0ABR9GEK6_9GAMM|nr:helix-turn-helix transcriptional regulator [Dyella acidiphila]MBE1162481.1 helix-turn-helix transcriptional regulator [Dyella acidiphila]